MLKRKIPSSGEELPVIGIGTWKTFDVTGSAYARLKVVLQQLINTGGTMIDSSPMYGKSEKVVGDITAGMPGKDEFFYATKVWTRGKEEGIEQMCESFRKLQRDKIDLMQVHNLLDLDLHFPVLQKWKDEGKIRYTGITHYTDDSHDELIRVMKKLKPDFVQFNYSIVNRNAEKNLLQAAADLGVATIINRPFGQGDNFLRVKDASLPSWAQEAGMHSWAEFFLKYILAHPAVNVVIPATGNPAHAADNMQAGTGTMPDESLRKDMIKFLESL